MVRMARIKFKVLAAVCSFVKNCQFLSRLHLLILIYQEKITLFHLFLLWIWCCHVVFSIFVSSLKSYLSVSKIMKQSTRNLFHFVTKSSLRLSGILSYICFSKNPRTSAALCWSTFGSHCSTFSLLVIIVVEFKYVIFKYKHHGGNDKFFR